MSSAHPLPLVAVVRSKARQCPQSSLQGALIRGSPRGPKGQSPGPPDGDGGERPLVDVGELRQHHRRRCEDAVGVQKGVEEIDAEKPQVRQPLQEALHAGVTDLGHFAGVECFTEANVNIVFMETGIRPVHKAGT